MRKCLIIWAFLVLPFVASATAQAPDILIWNNDTLKLFANPLQNRPGFDTLRTKLYGQRRGGVNTGCWRYYIAEWKIIKNELYLTNIFSCDYYTDGIKADLKALFGNEFKNGMVKASWVNGDVSVPIGELLYYIHMGYSSLYEQEIILSFENGKLTHQKTHENIGSHKSVFTSQIDTLKQFVYKRINWERIPEIKQRQLVRVYLESGAERKPEIIKITKKANEDILNGEILTALSSLPDWDVYYRRDQLYVGYWDFHIWFDEEIRRQYAGK